MSVKTRLIIFLIFAVLFFTITPYIILYSMGYRLDFAETKITTTGGIYVRAVPQGIDVTIDSKINSKTGLFSNSVFVKNLLPKQHNVLVKKEGYYNYEKNLLVKENQVTKLENIVLFKKEISFETLSDAKENFSLLTKLPDEKFFIKNNNLYRSDIQESGQIEKTQKSKMVIKDLVAYDDSNNKITWLGLDGFLKNSDLNGQNTQEISQVAIKINPKKNYRLKALGSEIFLLEDSNLLLLDRDTKSFQNFYSPVKNFEISPDFKKIAYQNDYEIFVYYLDESSSPDGNSKALLQKSTEKIKNLKWLNSDYVIFIQNDKIIISEIDARGNINSIKLPQAIVLSSGKSVEIKEPDIFFDRQDNKLYILTQDTLLASESLIP